MINDYLASEGSKRFADFEKLACSFALPGIDSDIAYLTLGLNGEAGEVAEKIKKIIRDKGGVVTELEKADLISELGDVLWYTTMIAHALGYSLKNVAASNIYKCCDRKSRGVIHGNGDDR